MLDVCKCYFMFVLVSFGRVFFHAGDAHENSTENGTLMILRMGLLAFNHFLRQWGVPRLNCTIRILTNEEYDD